jgi:colanic acid biosynthesis glycosyl transferase WcaI
LTQKTRLRILLVSQYFWPEDFRINEFVHRLAERGHDVEVLTGKPNYPGGEFFPGYGFFRPLRDAFGRIKVFRVPLLPRGKGSGLRLALNYLSFAFFASILGPFLCRNRYDGILVYQPSPVTAAFPAIVLKWLGAGPVLLWVQDLWPESLSATGAIQSPMVLRVVGWFVRRIYRASDRLLVQSEAFRSSVLRHGGREETIVYLPNSAEELYSPMTLPSSEPEHAEMPAGFRVMFAGNIGAAQDFESIVAAADQLRDEDIQWVVLGDGRMADRVREQVKDRALEHRVHLLGRRPLASMPRFFSLADAMLVTLRNEPIFALTVPAKVQSYLACAKPIIAAINGEGARIVEESGAGIACPAQDPSSLAASVLKMKRLSRSERDRMGEAGRQYFAANFSLELTVERLENQIRALGEGGRD